LGYWPLCSQGFTQGYFLATPSGFCSENHFLDLYTCREWKKCLQLLKHLCYPCPALTKLPDFVTGLNSKQPLRIKSFVLAPRSSPRHSTQPNSDFYSGALAMLISPSRFTHVVELYDQSMYVRAYHAAEQIAPLVEWEGTAARLLAGRIAATVGSPRLARKLQLQAYRHDPNNWEARYYYARMVLRYRGALEAWQFLQQHDRDPTLATAPLKIHSDWLAFHAFVLAQMRDFEAAEPWLSRAEKVAPDNVWVWVERAKVFELQDRYEDALSVLRYALMLQPWFRPTIQTSAHTLVLQGRDEEALRMLAQASQHVECAWLVEQMTNLQIELGQYEAARQSLERFAELSPRMEPEVLAQWQAQRAEAAYLSGDTAAALEFAQQCSAPALHKFAAQLQQGAGRRVVLPVGFVRQHHLTCTPATLATLSRYYQMPAEHLSIAEAICHDGTSAYNERQWALKNGYAAREFRVTWENAVALLDRKIAFTLGTIDPGGGHLQAVIGYDQWHHSLILRDPAERPYREVEANKLLTRYQACGPRGMALVPARQAERLNSLPLTESDAYDHLFALQEALEKHDREAANGIYQAMRQSYDEHRLTLQARLALATYDGDQMQLLMCYDKLLQLYPDDVNYQLSKVLCLRTQAQRQQRLDYLKQICTERRSHPLLWVEYARALGEDARQLPLALRWLRRALRRGALNARSVHLLADFHWQQQRREEALALYRFAASLDDTDEQCAQAFFLAARQLNQTEAALDFLQSRVQRQGEKSGRPFQTLFQALEQLGKKREAMAALATGLEKLPRDGQLKLYAVEVYARYGQFEQAAALLHKAQAQTARNEYLRAAAALAQYRSEHQEALQHWLQIAEAEPLASDAHQQVAQLLAETESPQAAVDYLRERLARAPHSTRLRELLVVHLRNDPAAAEAELQILLKHEPTNDWAQRQLADVLLTLRRADEAWRASEAACRLHPSSPENHCTRGRIFAQLGQTAQAREALRTAITLSADHTPAIVHLLATTTTAAERREALFLLHQELMRQVISGEGLLTFRNAAQETLAPEELLPLLRDIFKQRAEMPLVWSALITQLTEMNQLHEAFSLARQASERFPLTARAWLDLAAVHEARQEHEPQMQALQHAVSLEPSWLLAVQKLAEAHERQGQWSQAQSVLEQAIAHAPLNHFLRGSLAEVQWKAGEKARALTSIQRALALEPDYDWGWRALRTWSQEVHHPSLALQCARELTTKRPGDPRSWLILARTLKGEEALPEQLAALDRAIQLNPRLIEAHSWRAFLLADAGRFDEALRACRPAALAPTFPAELLSAEAHITAQCGDLPKALQKLRAVLKTAPNYAPGWERIARWYRTLEQEKDYLEAARQLTRLMPDYAVAHGYLGEAKLWNGDRAGAKEAFRRAFALAPDYDFAGLTLFDLHWEDKEVPAAEQVLAQLEQTVGSDATTLRTLKLAAHNKNQIKIQKHLFALCVSPAARTNYLDEAVQLLIATKFQTDVDIVVEDALALPGVNPHVGRLWVQRCAAQNKLDHCLHRLQAYADNAGRFWHRAAQAYLEIAATNQASEQVRQFVQKYPVLLNNETESWAAVGSALYNIGDLAEAVEWMSDWHVRPDVASWMLWELSLALRDLQREDEAKEVGLHAVNLPEDHRTGSHLALLSLDEALAGHIADATQHVEKIAPHAMREWERLLVTLATSLSQFHQARTEGRTIGPAIIDELLKVAQQAPWLRKSRSLVTLFQRAIDTILTTENDAMLKIKTKLKMKWFEYRASG
jgi:tetratricopeptide (TPR) repeat protein